jgi:type I restriction enzyme S subunit
VKLGVKELPCEWKWKTLGDIAEVIGGGTPSTRDVTNFGGNIPWLTPADLSGYTSKFISHGERFITEHGLKTSSAKMMPMGTVLFTSRAPIGYVAIASTSLCTNQGFKSFVLKEGVLPDYLYWWLKGNKELAESFASGTTFLELSGTKAKQLPIPIPSTTEEQEQIVAEIEKQFSRLDEAVTALNRIQANLKRYKVAVLKAAVEGKLTERWRKDHPEVEPADQLLKRILAERRAKWEAEDLAKIKAKGIKPKDDSWKKKYNEPAAPDTANLPELPEGWVWASLDQLTSKITDGEHISPTTTHNGEPLLSAKDVQDNGVLFEDAKFVTTEDAEKFRLRCDPEYGDILIVSRGATIGRTCRVQTKRYFCLMGSVILAKPVHLLESRCLSASLKSRELQKAMIALSGSTAQQAIYIRDIKSLPIPLSPLAEQLAIIAEIDLRLSVTEELETTIVINRKRAERLRQMILLNAFSGGKS